MHSTGDSLKLKIITKQRARSESLIGEELLVVCNDHTIGYSTSDSVNSSKFHSFALLVALVALMSHSSNFHHWPLLALLVALVLPSVSLNGPPIAES